MLLHARFVLGLELFHLGLLVGREHLVELVVNASLLNRDLGFDLRLLRCQGLNFVLIEGSFDILAKLNINLVLLLEQRLHDRMLFLHHGLHLGFLVVRKVELLGEESHHLAVHAEFMAVHRRWRRSIGGGLRLGDGATQQNGHGGDQ